MAYALLPALLFMIRAAGSPTTSRPGAAVDVAAAIRDLADARWQTRRDAAYRLVDIGEPALEPLRNAYFHARHHEVRLRIRELAESIFSQRYLADRGGFLGIRQRPRFRYQDPRISLGTSWIEVLQVFPDTAAERAGLAPGDLIVACDGTRFPEDPVGQAFSTLVARRRPGEEVNLSVQRADRRLDIRARLGYRPAFTIADGEPILYDTIRRAFEEWWLGGQPQAEAGSAPPPAASQPADPSPGNPTGR